MIARSGRPRRRAAARCARPRSWRRSGARKSTFTPPKRVPEARPETRKMAEVRRLERLPGLGLRLRRQHVEQLVARVRESRTRSSPSASSTPITPATNTSAPPSISIQPRARPAACAESKRSPSTPVLWMSGTSVASAITTTAAPIAIRARPPAGCARDRPPGHHRRHDPQQDQGVCMFLTPVGHAGATQRGVRQVAAGGGKDLYRAQGRELRGDHQRSARQCASIRTTIHTGSSRRKAADLLLRFSAVSGRGLPDSPVMRTATP